MIKKRNKLYLVIYIFCFLFAPPFIKGINFSFILCVYSLIALVLKYPQKTAKIYKSKDIVRLIMMLSLYIIIYSISFSMSTIFDNSDISSNFILNLYSIFLNFFVTFVCSTYLVFKMDDYNLSKSDLMKYIVYATLIQLLIALTSLCIPSFKTWTINKMLKETNSKLLNTPWLLARRFYGFSNNLLDLFGFGIGIICTVSLYYSTKEKRFMFYAPLLLILAILNSRTGIIIFSIGLFIFILSKIKLKQIKITKLVKASVVIITLIIVAYKVVQIKSPDTISWILKDFSSFFKSEEVEGTATAIYSKRFWTIPDDFKIVFGAGYSISGYSTSSVGDIVHSDCGYVNEIWKVGIIGLALYLIMHLYIIRKCIIYEENINYKSLYTFFMISMLIFLVKGSLLGFNPGNVVIYTMFLYSVYEKKKGLINNE